MQSLLLLSNDDDRLIKRKETIWHLDICMYNIDDELQKTYPIICVVISEDDKIELEQ